MAPSFRIMMCQQFWLRFSRLSKLLLQHLGDPLVVPLSGALQERLVGRILHQGVLKSIGRVWGKTTLIQ